NVKRKEPALPRGGTKARCAGKRTTRIEDERTLVSGPPSTRNEHQRIRSRMTMQKKNGVDSARPRLGHHLPAYSHIGGVKRHGSRHSGGSTEVGRGAGHPRRHFGNRRGRRSDDQTRGQRRQSAVPWPSLRQTREVT